jgi:hypothetical protein
MEREIALILEQENPSWFTRLLKGDCLHRYVVAFTHNVKWSLKTLDYQQQFFWLSFDNLTIWWRADPQGKSIVDIGTSTDNFRLAWAYKTHYNQEAIWDSWLKIEIF